MEFLKGLETLVFDPDFQQRVRERSQLHQLLAENAWVFGEQYSLCVDDPSLTEALKEHFAGHEIQIDEEVRRSNGTRGIIDLMFSRNVQLAGSEQREHLIVELKRPNTKIDGNAVLQIKSHAFAIAEDERFRNLPAKWAFWIVSNEIDAYTDHDMRPRHMTPGVLFESGPSDNIRMTIWVKTWSQLLRESKARMRFFAEKLSHAPDLDSSPKHLAGTYHKYL